MQIRKDAAENVASRKEEIKREIQEMLERQKEDDYKTEQYLSGLKKCPKCHANVIKNGGCNHISCVCGCHFCWICGYYTSDSFYIYEHLTNTHGSIFGNDMDNDDE